MRYFQVLECATDTHAKHILRKKKKKKQLTLKFSHSYLVWERDLVWKRILLCNLSLEINCINSGKMQ